MRRSLTTTIIVIFLIFNVLSILLFTYYAKAEGDNSAVAYAKRSMQEIVNEKSKLIAIRFDRMVTSVDLLHAVVEGALREEPVDVDQISDAYVFNGDGSVKRIKDEGKSADEQSNVLVAWNGKNKKQVMEEIMLTEKLDEPMSIILKNEEVIWGYIVTRNNFLRVSPYSDLDEYFDLNHLQNEDIFYTMADAEHNPQRKAIITKPYNDYLGEGWTITCSYPVYARNEEMFGVVCLDVSMKKMREEFFAGFSLGESGKIFWLDQSGNLFYHSDYDKLSNIQGEIYDKNIFALQKMSEEEENAIREALSHDSGIILFQGLQGRQILVYSKIEDLDSSLIIQMDMDEFAAGEQFDLKKLLLLISIEVLLAGIFALLLYRSFSKPMRKLVRQAERISEGDYGTIEENANYYEIAQLNKAFNVMNQSIETYTETLIDKNKEVSTILESIDDTLMIVDMDGNVGIRNRESRGICAERTEKALSRIKESRLSFEEQFVQDGEVYKNVYYPIVLQNGEVRKVVISSKCVTNSTLMEKELQQLEKMAGVGQLSAAIVHELKNVLARIKGAVYILSMTEQDEENREEIETISRAAEEAQNVITTLLDFSRKSNDESDMTNVSSVIHQILLLSKKELITKNIAVDLHLDDDCYIHAAGKEALKVILQNTIINAIQAVEDDGKIAIRCRREAENVIIHIRDNGGGIKIEPKERIFEPFLSTKEEGTGIGLWITKRLVNTLSGKIEIVDGKRNETEFKITIPVKEKTDAEDKGFAG